MLVETVGQDAARLQDRGPAQQFEIARMSPSALQLRPDTVILSSACEWPIPFQLVARESGERLL